MLYVTRKAFASYSLIIITYNILIEHFLAYAVNGSIEFNAAPPI